MADVTEDFVDDPDVWPTMLSLVECLKLEVAKRRLPAPCFIGVLPGGQAGLDFGGPEQKAAGRGNGQMWVRLADGYPSNQFPIPLQIGSTCASPLAFTIEIGSVRCMPQPRKVGQGLVLPDDADLAEVTRLQMADMRAMRAAIACCVQRTGQAEDEFDYTLQTYTPLVAQGGVVGGVWTVIVTQRGL